MVKTPSIVTQILERMSRGETVYVKYENAGGIGDYGDFYTNNILKLVPNSDGTYDRHWRDGNEWSHVQHRETPYLPNGDDNFNAAVHVGIFESEAEAIAWYESMKAEAARSNNE